MFSHVRIWEKWTFGKRQACLAFGQFQEENSLFIDEDASINFEFIHNFIAYDLQLLWEFWRNMFLPFDLNVQEFHLGIDNNNS